MSGRVLALAVALSACASELATVPPAERGKALAVPAIGWLSGACLATLESGLPTGTPVQVVRLEQPQQVVSATVQAPARSAQDCQAIHEGRRGLVDGQPVRYYRMTSWSDDPAEMAIGVIGATPGIIVADGLAHLDVAGDKRRAVFGVCTTSESILFGLWPDGRIGRDAVWSGTYQLDYDLQPSCPPA